MTPHSSTCPCFRCFITNEADRRMDAGSLDPWEVPTLLTEIVADIVASHPDINERARRAEWFAHQLLEAVELPYPANESEQSSGDILPFRPALRG